MIRRNEHWTFFFKEKTPQTKQPYAIQGTTEHKGRGNSDKYIQVPTATYQFYEVSPWCEWVSAQAESLWTNRERSWNALRQAEVRCFCWWEYFLLNIWGIRGSCLLLLLTKTQKIGSWQFLLQRPPGLEWSHFSWMRHQTKAMQTFGLFMLLLFSLLLLLYIYFQMNAEGRFFVVVVFNTKHFQDYFVQKSLKPH